MKTLTIKNIDVLTDDPSKLMDVFEQYRRLDSVLVSDGFHSAKHRKPVFLANSVHVRWKNCRERVKGYRLQKHFLDNKEAITLFYFLI